MSLRVHSAAVLIGAALLATPVLADSGANAPFGIVNARGTGTAIASGQMVLVGVVRGPATIVIRDRVADGDEGAAERHEVRRRTLRRRDGHHGSDGGKGMAAG